MRFFFLLLFLLLTNIAIAPDIRTLTIIEPEPVDLFDKLMRAVVQVESLGDTLAFNYVEQAYGPFQIRPIRLLDFNQRTGKKYVLKDCFRMSISKEIFLYYAERIGYPHYETIARRWNGSGVKTIEYWTKVKANLDKIARASSE